MNDIVVYIFSNIMVKLIRIIKISYNIGVLGRSYDEFYLVLDILSIIRYLFINNQFSYIISQYYKTYGEGFKKWFLKVYIPIIACITAFIAFFGHSFFYLFNLQSSKLAIFAFFIRWLSFLAPLMFFLGFFKGLLYTNRNLYSISLAVPVASFCTLLVLLFNPVSIPFTLVGSQLLYAAIQCVFFYYSLNNSNFTAVFLDYWKFHQEMIIILANSLMMVGTRLIGGVILSKNSGKLSLSKYANDIIWTIIGLISAPISDYFLIQNKEDNSKQILYVHYINLLIMLLMFSALKISKYVFNLQSDIMKFGAINILIVYPAIQNRLLQVINTTKGRSKNTFYSNLIQSVIQISIIIILINFKITNYIIPSISLVTSYYFQTLVLFYTNIKDNYHEYLQSFVLFICSYLILSYLL